MMVQKIPLFFLVVGFVLGPGVCLDAVAAKKNKASISVLSEGPKKTKSVRTKLPKNDQEKLTERERRLMRECKGRPNSGACLGYAS